CEWMAAFAFRRFCLVLLWGRGGRTQGSPLQEDCDTLGGVAERRQKRKNPRDKDLTSQYLRGAMEEDALDSQERYSGRDASAQKKKMEQTAQMRAAEEVGTPDVEKLPIGGVTQVYSLVADVEFEGKSW